jgi:integrator complex subunit 2
LRNGDKQDDDGSNKIRQDAILLLCEMNPSEIVTVRNKCIEWCKMPSLALFLTLEAQKREKNSDLISFLSGLLLGSDPLIRSWISFFVRNGQKKRSEDALNAYRKVLLATLGELVTEVRSENSSQEAVVRSCALLRLYTALRGIAGMKLSEQEIALLSDLITCRPPATPAGVQFVSLGLSVLIACNSLISTPQLEKKAVEWIKWLVREEEYFERKSGVSASFGEMLLLMAIHFHSQNLASIIDLVCQTLGMKIAIRTTNMNRMKAIFTQDIFNEQVVASHAVKVPVTRNLSSEISGFLPVHCIHQLLKSRTFSKHKVPIKEWVYNQICVSSTPLHPVLPALIEVYVNSVLVPASNRSVIEQTNEAISEEEIKAVFARPVFEMPAAGALASGSANFFATPGAMPRGRLLKSRDSTPFRMTPSSSPRISAKSEVDVPQSFSIATQILILYYVLLYEQVRLSHMKTILTTQRKVLRYSRALLSQLPIKYLLMTAERDQHRFGGVFPQLLKLCSTQHPHLCLVQDWLEDEARSKDFAMKAGVARKSVSMTEVVEAFALLKECPSKLTIVMEKMLTLPADELWKYSDITLRHIGTIIEPNTPRQVMGELCELNSARVFYCAYLLNEFNIAELYKRLWFELNKVFPRKLWVATINSIVHPDTGNYRGRKNITEEDLILDPLQVLRCDRRIFRAGPILEIVLYVLKACLAASRTHLSQHLQENPIIERNAQHVNNIHQVTNDGEREELKNALIGTQESAAIQILLEAGMPFPGDEDDEHVLSNVKEVQSLICSYLHESFIADPTLAKLVHFQVICANAIASSPWPHTNNTHFQVICANAIASSSSWPYNNKNNKNNNEMHFFPSGLPVGPAFRHCARRPLHAHLSGLCAGTPQSARPWQAGFCCQPNLASVNPVRAPKVLLYRKTRR